MSVCVGWHRLHGCDEAGYKGVKLIAAEGSVELKRCLHGNREMFRYFL